MSQPWNKLVATAVPGTARAQPTNTQATDDVSRLLSRLAPDDRERAVLDASAVLGLWRKAGMRPQQVATAPLPAAPPDPLPVCDVVLRRALHVVLREQLYCESVPELLAELNARQQRVPEDLLPPLLDLGVKQPELWPSIEPVIGTRGRWLAQHNPTWVAVLGADDEAAWEHGSGTQRRAALRRLRERDPDRARDLLAAAWQQEDHRERADFLATLRQGLGASDEALLEAALDDRRKEVRSVAAELLACLPASRLVGGMVERAEALLRYSHPQRSRWFKLPGKRGGVIEVTLPEACTKAMQRDGIELQAGRSEYGDKAWWLVQVLAAVPPARWSTAWDAAPIDVLLAAYASEWSAALLEGFARATHRYHDAAWAGSFVGDDLTAGVDRGKHAPVTLAWLWHCVQRHELFQILAPEQRESVLMRLCRSRQVERRAAFWSLLRGCEHAWSLDLSRLVVDELRRAVAADTPRDVLDFRDDLPLFARRMAPALCGELRHGWDENLPNCHLWQAPVANMVATVEFRASFRST